MLSNKVRYPALGQQGKNGWLPFTANKITWTHFCGKRGGWVIPEEKTVTKAEQTILSPSWNAAVFYLTQQQTFDISLHGLVEFWKPKTLKVPVSERGKKCFSKKEKRFSVMSRKSECCTHYRSIHSLSAAGWRPGSFRKKILSRSWFLLLTKSKETVSFSTLSKEFASNSTVTYCPATRTWEGIISTVFRSISLNTHHLFNLGV